MITLTSLYDEGAQLFSRLTEAQLRQSTEAERGIFIAESPKVIRVALDAGYEPIALLCERKHIDGDAADIVARCRHLPIYTGERELLAQLTGYTLTRGVLCAMQRPLLPEAAVICREAHRVAVIDAVTDTTNIGAIFRSAAALGIDAVLLTRDACDPLNRRAVRALGFRTAAMALTDASIPLDDPQLKREPRLAIILGTEGDGLPQQVIRDADYTVRIPMSHQVDSLNVAAASAVAFWELRQVAENHKKV